MWIICPQNEVIASLLFTFPAPWNWPTCAKILFYLGAEEGFRTKLWTHYIPHKGIQTWLFLAANCPAKLGVSTHHPLLFRSALMTSRFGFPYYTYWNNDCPEIHQPVEEPIRVVQHVVNCSWALSICVIAMTAVHTDSEVSSASLEVPDL